MNVIPTAAPIKFSLVSYWLIRIANNMVPDGFSALS